MGQDQIALVGGVLRHENRVRSPREGGSRHDSNGLPGSDLEVGLLSRQDLSDHPESGRVRRAGAEGLGRPKGEAVHGALVEVRYLGLGDDVPSQGPAQGLCQGDRLSR